MVSRPSLSPSDITGVVDSTLALVVTRLPFNTLQNEQNSIMPGVRDVRCVVIVKCVLDKELS